MVIIFIYLKNINFMYPLLKVVITILGKKDFYIINWLKNIFKIKIFLLAIGKMSIIFCTGIFE